MHIVPSATEFIWQSSSLWFVFPSLAGCLHIWWKKSGNSGEFFFPSRPLTSFKDVPLIWMLPLHEHKATDCSVTHTHTRIIILWVIIAQLRYKLMSEDIQIIDAYGDSMDGEIWNLSLKSQASSWLAWNWNRWKHFACMGAPQVTSLAFVAESNVSQMQSFLSWRSVNLKGCKWYDKSASCAFPTSLSSLANLTMS